MTIFKKAALLAACVAVSACAQQPHKIEASYVSRSAFEGKGCNDLLAERNDIVRHVNDLSAKQKKAATTDAVATGVALVLFWPAAFALATTSDNSGALSLAKGNYDAISSQMQLQGCNVPNDQFAAV
ncbi:MAG: hypothetical protein AAGA05_12945 [Pseudomonadota bacterium]